MRRTLTVAITVLGIAACGTAPPRADPTPVSETQPAPPPPNAAFLPANTHLSVTLAEDLNARTAQIGDVFTVTVVEPIVAQNRATVVPENTVITGLITGVIRASGMDEQAAIRLNIVRMNLRGVSHPLSAAVVRTALGPPPDTTDTTAADATDSASVDMTLPVALGAVIIGARRTALIAASLGTGAGTIVSLGTGADGILPAGTEMTIRTRDRIDLRN